MVTEVAQNGHGLEALRIARPKHQQHQRSRKRRPLPSIMTTVVVLIIVGAIAYAFYAETIGRPATVQTMIATPVAQGAAGVLFAGSGYVVTRHKYITIGTKILGQIVDEPIEEGQHVKVGDILARIDDRDYQAQLRQAIADTDVAKAKLQLLRDKADRARRLIDRGAISQDEFDTAINAADVGDAELRRDEAAVDFARFNVNQCVISSPINGIVLKKYRELGDTINFGGEIQAGGGATDIAQLADTEDMRAEVDINEVDIAKVDINSPATVVLDAYPDHPFDATLVKVYPEADRQKGTVKVEVQIAKADLRIIKPEMSVKVSFLESRKSLTSEPLLTIPKGAIKTDESESYVWTVRDGIAKRALIICGQELETGVEVKQGINAGDVVIIEATQPLHDGEKVTVK